MLKKIFLGMAAAVGLLLIVGLVLPRKIHVERTVVIAAPKSSVFATLTNLHEFNTWSPWAKLDPDATYTYSGPDVGIGAHMAWSGPKTGTGTQEIIAIDSDRRITLALDFGDMGRATAYYRLEPVEAGTELTWGFDEDVGMNLMARYFGLAMDNMVGGMYASGLATLKHNLEAPPPPGGQ